jgi:hypothetical protein
MDRVAHELVTELEIVAGQPHLTCRVKLDRLMTTS